MSEQPDEGLEALDPELLNAVQWDFPLTAAPYAALGERLGISEDEVRARLRAAKDAGVLRQLSAIFDTRALGYSSALVAAKVDPDRVDEAAEVISRHPGVSHNYKRNHAYNLWYTLAVPPGEDIDEHLDVLHRESGSLVTRKLPTLQLYKIGVKLDMTGATAADARTEVLEHERPERRARHGSAGARRARGRDDLDRAGRSPDDPRPFAVMGEKLGIGEDRVLEILESFRTRKLMRRFAAVMNHRSAGFKANAMGVWAVPEGALGEIGPRMASFSAVSHCYRRPTYEDWPYTVFTMVHGHNARDCEATIEAIRDETGIDRVRAALVDQGVQEGAVALLHARLAGVARHPPHCRDRLARDRSRDATRDARHADTGSRRAGDHGRGHALPGAARAARERAGATRRSPTRSSGRGAQPSARSRSLATTHGWTR